MFHSGVVGYSVHRKGNRNCSFVCFWKLNISQRFFWFLMTVCNNWTNQKQQSTIFCPFVILYVSRIYNVKSILVAISKPYDKITLKFWTNKCIIFKEYTFHAYNTITYLDGRRLNLLSDWCVDPNLSWYFPWCQYQLLSYTECHFICRPPVNNISWWINHCLSPADYITGSRSDQRMMICPLWYILTNVHLASVRLL